MLSWVMTAYLLAATISGPVYEKPGDLYGRQLLLQSAIVIFLVGSALCGISENMIEVIVFRAVQGLGGGGLFVLTIAVVGDFIARRERGPSSPSSDFGSTCQSRHCVGRLEPWPQPRA